MQLRHELANAVIQAIGAQSYLQLGSARAIAEIDCPGKQSYYLESADQIPPGKVYDVVFVDPPHDPGRALFALNVGLEHLSPAGVLLVANVNPAEEWMQEVPASAGVALGQAWRAWLEFRATCGRYTYTANLDHGVGVMVAGPESDRFDASHVRVDFKTFAENRYGLLNMADPESVLLAVRALRSDAQRDAVVEVMAGAPLASVPSQPMADTAPAPTEAEPETATDPAVPPVTAPRRKRRDRGTP